MIGIKYYYSSGKYSWEIRYDIFVYYGIIFNIGIQCGRARYFDTYDLTSSVCIEYKICEPTITYTILEYNDGIKKFSPIYYYMGQQIPYTRTLIRQRKQNIFIE